MFLLKTAFAEYAVKNVQAKIVAKTLITLYYSDSVGNKGHITEVFELISEIVSESEIDEIDTAIRTLIYFLE